MNPQNTSSITKFVVQFDIFFALFSHHFTAYRRDCAPVAKGYVSGLIQQIPRKNIERIHEHVPQGTYDAQHNFISNSPWCAAALNRHIAQRANALVGGQRSSLELDESAFTKAGRESVGVARQYNGRLGKKDNCQVAVFAALACKDRYALIGSRLYLPKVWIADAARCTKAGIQEDQRVFKTKPQLALELVDEARAAGVEFGTVSADAVYGGREFAYELERRGITFSLDILSNQHVYLDHPQPYIPEPKSSQGRRPSVVKSRKRATSVATIAKRLKADQWSGIRVWKGTKGTIRVEAVALRVYFWHARHPSAPAQRWLVITRQLGGKEIKFFMSNAEANVSLRTLIASHRSRYWIERSFQDSKTSIGMADYQVRKWQGWHHHVSLCMLALLFMLTLKERTTAELPRLSCQDVVMVMHHYLPKRIRTEHDLIDTIVKRHEKRKRAEVSALRCQKRRDRQKSKVPK